jgi:hypothetical protein
MTYAISKSSEVREHFGISAMKKVYLCHSKDKEWLGYNLKKSML